MPVLRIVYEKKYCSRFISSNYIGRIFERCLRRISVLFEFSQGFNRRVRMSLGPPLAVGIAGNNEIIDVHLKNKNISQEMIKETLNSILPEGLKVVSCFYIEETEKSPPDVISARYVVRIRDKNTLSSLPDCWKIVYVKDDYLMLEVSIEKLKHRQLFDIFGAENVLERFLIF